jgi:hypothetical protein
MTLAPRERRALLLLVVGLAAAGITQLYLGPPATISVASANVNQDGNALSLQHLVRLRQIAATLPAREAAMKQSAADLADRERSIIQADTAPQAQAALLEIARRIGKNDEIDVRGGEFGAPKPFGDYGLVYASITFDCRIEQLVNFLADLSHQPELIAPSEERFVTGNAKDKTVGVRMVLAGVVAKKLTPQKKGLAAF